MYTDTLQQAWDFQSTSNGRLVSFTCKADLNGDGAEDCALVMYYPVGLPFLPCRGRSAVACYSFLYVSDIGGDSKRR